METIEHTKQPVCTDWDRIDIKAALERRGWSLSRLSKEHGYVRYAAIKVLQKPWPQLEWIVAEALGKKPWEIWPSRYPNGPEENRPGRGEKPRRTRCYNLSKRNKSQSQT